MAATVYQIGARASTNPIGAIDEAALFLKHAISWGLTPTGVSINSGFLRFTLNNPIPADQLTHLNVTQI